MVDQVGRYTYNPKDNLEQDLIVTTPDGNTTKYSMQEALLMGFSPTNLNGDTPLYSYKDSDGNTREQLTLKGQQRYERAHAKNIAKPKDKRIKDEDELVNPDQWVRDDLDSASDIINSAKSMVESASKIRTEYRSTKGTKRLDLSNMTTQQIREANEREAAERRYNELFNPPKESQVSKFVDGFFKTPFVNTPFIICKNNWIK